MFWHKSFGLLMGGAIVARIGAAIITRRPAAVPGPVYEQLAGKLTHAALCKISGWCGGNPPSPFHASYVACDEWTTDGFMIFMPVSGIVMGYYRYTCDSHCLLLHPSRFLATHTTPQPNSGKGLPFFATTIPGKTENREPSDGATAKQAYLLHKQVRPTAVRPPTFPLVCTQSRGAVRTAQVGYIMEWVIGAHVGAVIFHATRGQMIMNRILPGKSVAPTL